MFDDADVVYRYDGTFDGLLCCVFESYEKKELPADILSPDKTTLFSVKVVATEEDKARRVLASIPEKIGPAALDFVRRAFLTCFARKELHILLFLRKGFRLGPSVMRHLTDDTVAALVKAVRHLDRESHLLKGFIRFSARGGTLVGEIEPKNRVLPLLAEHFCERFPEERFLICDRTHAMGLVYAPYRFAILPIGEMAAPEPDAAEASFRRLWQIFYDTIEIKPRRNEKCRMTQMPKRYWRFMTEFQRGDQSHDLSGGENIAQIVRLNERL